MPERVRRRVGWASRTRPDGTAGSDDDIAELAGRIFDMARDGAPTAVDAARVFGRTENLELFGSSDRK